MTKKIKVSPISIGGKNSEDVIFTDTFFYSQPFLGSEVSLFALFEVKVPHPDTKPIFNSIKSVLKRNMFIEDPEQDFDNTLKSINSEIEKILSFSEVQKIPKSWFKSFGSTIGIIYENNLLISTTGGTTAYLSRRGDLEEISSDQSPFEDFPSFSTISSGSIEDEDKLILISSDLNFSINKERLKISLSREIIKTLEFLDNESHQNDGINCAIVLSCESSKSQSLENIVSSSKKLQDEIKNDTLLVQKNENINFPKIDFKNLKTSFFLIIQYFKKNIPVFVSKSKVFLLTFFDSLFNKQGIQELRANIEKSSSSGIVSGIQKNRSQFFSNFSTPVNFNKFFQFKWLTVNGKIFFSILLILSIFIGFRSCNNSKDTSSKEITLSDQKTKLLKAKELVSVANSTYKTKQTNYQVVAEEKLKLAESELKDVTELSFKQEKNTILENIELLRKDMQGIKDAGTSSLIADFTTISDTILSFQFVEPDEIYAFGEKGIYNFRIPADESALPVSVNKLSIDTSSLGNVISSSSADENQIMVLYSDLNGTKNIWNFKYAGDNKSITKADLPNSLSWPIGVAIDTWDSGSNTFLYLLSPQQNKIFKYTPTQSGYGTPVNYFKSPVDLTTSVSIGIDGSVYVLNTNGILDVYTSGVLVKSNNLKEIANLEEPTKMFKNLAKTNSEQDFLFVLDLKKKFLSVLKVEQDGSLTLKTNLNISELLSGNSVQEFYPIKSNGIYEKVIFLINNKLVFLELNL